MNWLFGNNPGLQPNYGGRETRRPPPVFRIPLKAYPALYLGREDLETGNKVLLPPAILHNISNYKFPQPMMFSLQNTMLGNSTNVGVLEFTADNGMCIVPNWLFEHLNLDYGAEVNLQLLLEVYKGTYVKLQPHKTEFIELPDPKAILERNLSNYVCVTKGDTISIKVVSKFYKFDILEVKPKSQMDCICLIETNIEVDFAPPLDYVERPPDLVRKESDVKLDEDEKEVKGPFSGKGIRINGQVVDESKVQKKISDDVYDPRKHRIVNGIRSNTGLHHFQGQGIKIGESSKPGTGSKLGGSQGSTTLGSGKGTGTTQNLSNGATQGKNISTKK